WPNETGNRCACPALAYGTRNACAAPATVGESRRVNHATAVTLEVIRARERGKAMRRRIFLAREPGDRPERTPLGRCGGRCPDMAAPGRSRNTCPLDSAVCGGHAERGRRVMFWSCRGALLALSMLPAPAQSQSDVPAQSEIPSGDVVVVTASRFAQPAHEAPVGMVVVTGEEIMRSGVSTLPQLLARQPGITVRDNSGSPDQQVDMRGFGITGDQN